MNTITQKESQLRTHFAELSTKLRTLSQSKDKVVLEVNSWVYEKSANWTIKYRDGSKICEYKQEITFKVEGK